MIQIVGNVLVAVTTVLAWAFVVLYAAWAPWRRSEMGRHVMTYSLVIAAVLSLSMARMIGGAGLDTPWFALTRLIVFIGVPVSLGWRIAILWRAQRRGRHQPK